MLWFEVKYLVKLYIKHLLTFFYLNLNEMYHSRKRNVLSRKIGDWVYQGKG